jgi:hypothetical protein
MFSPGQYTLCNLIDLHLYYNIPANQPLLCGFCRKRNQANTALQDYRLSDSLTHWYYCPTCGFAGTGLDYIAASESITPLKALKKLIKDQYLETLSAPILHQFNDYLNGIEHLRGSYSTASEFRRSESHALNALYDLDFYPPAKSFRNGSRQEFERWFRRNLKRGDHNTSSSRVFHGRSWSRITAIPIYDMPLRMSSILFVNGHEQPSHAIALKRLGPVSGKQYAFDPGYLAPRSLCGEKLQNVILSSDWKLTLRLQAEAYKQDRKYAPLFGWFPTDPLTSKSQTYHWSYLKHTNKIFWAQANDIRSLREACLQTAMISCVPYPVEQQIFAGVMLRDVIKNALPWYTALTTLLDHDITKAEKRLEYLNLPDRIIDMYLSKAPASIRSLLSTKYFKLGLSPARFVDGDMIESDTEGWWRTSAKTDTQRVLLSNVRCLIDKVVHLANHETMLQGRILIGDKEYPFTESESVFEKNTIKLVKQICIDQCCEYFINISIKQDKFLRIIKAMSGQPKVIHIRNGFGWSVYDTAFSFPNITISDTIVINTELNLASCPFHALNVKHTETITALQQTSLANFKEESPFILAIFVSMIPVLLASAYRMSVPQTVVAGGDIAFLQQIFRMLGLPQFPITAGAEIEKYETTHKCPYLVRIDDAGSGTKKRTPPTWADVLGFHGPGFIAAPLFTALSRMSYGNANLLLLPGHRFYRWFEGKLPEIFLKCFVGCLQHFSRYALNPKPCSENWNDDLLQEAIDYFENKLGLPVSKKTIYDGYYDASSYFCDYINLLKRSEKLTFDQSETECRISTIALSDCYRQHVGMFDLEKIQSVLLQGNLLKSYDTKNHAFVLDAEIINRGARRLEQFYGTMIRNN